MADEANAAVVINAQVNSAYAGSEGRKELQLLKDAARSLPSPFVTELLSLAICETCIFRLFGVEANIYCCTSLSPAILRSILEEAASSKSELNSEVCSICFGILQFSYLDENDVLVKKESANDVAFSIAEMVKREGHQIDSFSLEVSAPPEILENENTVLSHMRKKYGSEHWFQEGMLCVRDSVKDVLKMAITKLLETLLDVTCNSSSFRIRLTCTHTKTSKTAQNSVELCHYTKRPKRGTENGLHTTNDDFVTAGAEVSSYCATETSVVTEGSFNSLQDKKSAEFFGLSLEKASQPCHLTYVCYRMPIYLGGRYLKYSRNVSQTRWIIDEERMGEASVEEIIGGNVLPMYRGDNYKFHAAGREDIDVRMLGSGRPFLVEIQNARQLPSNAIVKEIEEKINKLENKLVAVKNLEVVGSQGWTLMREGESEKQKQYAALVWISRPLEDEDLQCISSHKDMQILQKTPIRVLHRRSPLERKKIIHWMKIERIPESSQYFILHLCTQAGTYIKEFVHGDLGRTNPSVGSLLRCRAEISQLDVTDVKMDCFLPE